MWSIFASFSSTGQLSSGRLDTFAMAYKCVIHVYIENLTYTCVSTVNPLYKVTPPLRETYLAFQNLSMTLFECVYKCFIHVFYNIVAVCIQGLTYRVVSLPVYKTSHIHFKPPGPCTTLLRKNIKNIQTVRYLMIILLGEISMKLGCNHERLMGYHWWSRIWSQRSSSSHVGVMNQQQKHFRYLQI